MASRKEYALEVLLGARTKPSFQSSINKGRQGLKSLSSSAKKAAALVTGAFAAVNVGGVVKDSIEVYSGFEQQLAASAATAGATETEYRKMEQASREAGKATIKTAEESASALGYMALAGWDVEQSTQGLMPVLKLSAATNLELAETSDLVTDSMSALKMDVKDLPAYLDLVTKANNSANTTSQQLMQAFIKSGGAARTLKMDVKDSAIALGILANNGTKAEEGGRTLNAILTRISSNKNALDEMKALKIKIFEKGQFVGMEEALKRINKGVEGLTVEKKAKALKNIAGTNYYSKMAYLLDGVKSGAKGAESAWDDLEDKLGDSDGTLDEMYAKMTNTMSGATETMKSAMDDAKISFADAFDGEMVEVLNGLSGAFNVVSDGIADFAKENEVEIHQTFEEMKEWVLSAGEAVGDFGSLIADNFDLVASGITGIGVAMGTYKVASGIAKIVTSLGAVSASPIGIFALAASAVAGLGAYAKRTHDNMVRAGLEEHFGNVSLSLEDLDEIAQEIVGKKTLAKISAMLESIGDTDKSIESMKDSLSDMERIDWKFKAGFKIDKADRELYAESAKQYVKYAQEALDNKAYTVHVATEVLFGKGSKIGMENDAFYSGLDAELDHLQKRLNKRIEKAVKNGMDINTDKTAQELLKKIGDITDIVTEAENESELQALELKYSGKDLTASDFKQISKDIQKYEEQVDSGAEDAYKSSMTALNARLKKKDISKKGYDAEAKEIKQAYFDTKAKALKNGSDFYIQTIKDAYPEVSAAMEKYEAKLREQFKKQSEQGISPDDLSEQSYLSVSGIWEDPEMEEMDAVKPEIRELYEYGLKKNREYAEELAQQEKSSGMKVSAPLNENMWDIKTLSALSGNDYDAYELLGKAISGDDGLAAIVKTSEEIGGAVPEGVAEGMDNNSTRVLEAAENLVGLVKKRMEEAGAGMKITLTPDIVYGALPEIDSKPAMTQLRPQKTLKAATLPKPAKKGGNKNQKILSNAEGGIYFNPILTTFAEEGPEAAIPLDGSSRAKTLWQQAGEILGMIPAGNKAVYGNIPSPDRDKAIYQDTLKLKPAAATVPESTPDIKINYAPVIEIKGDADQKALAKTLRISQAEFAEMMDTYLASKGRTSFAH